MERCKGCGSVKLVKNGKTRHGNQRYKYKNCGGNYGEGDKRLKHGLDKRIKVIRMYLEGVGIRSIGRLEGVPNPLIYILDKTFFLINKKRVKSYTNTR